mgnify:CR=1 FL=1
MSRASDRVNIAKRSQGNIGLKEIEDAIRHYLQHGDWTRISRLAAGLGRTDGAIVREICERCLTGVQLVPSRKHEAGWRLKKVDDLVEASPALNVVSKLAADGKSFRSKIVAERLVLKAGQQEEFDLDTALKRIIERSHEVGKSDEVLAELELCRRRVFRLDR